MQLLLLGLSGLGSTTFINPLRDLVVYGVDDKFQSRSVGIENLFNRRTVENNAISPHSRDPGSVTRRPLGRTIPRLNEKLAPLITRHPAAAARSRNRADATIIAASPCSAGSPSRD
ncbi:MAG: hypothetical protein IT449_11885 [Phycisphaerales bacterium]|nr:hypothetical protein [Phycisphaerales bacterium]